MGALYIGSFVKGVGKTAIGVGLGKYMLDNGKKVAFFKPIITDDTATEQECGNNDVAFVKQIFDLEEPLGNICPLINSSDNLAGKIEEAYNQVSPGKDVVIVEANCEIDSVCQKVIAILNAKVIIVAGYTEELTEVEAIRRCQSFGESLLGVVLNKVPQSLLEYVHDNVSTRFTEMGINILGVLPEDRAMSALTIGELAEYIHGEVLNSTEQSTELVENYMLGAMIIDSGLEYFDRKTKKAVVLNSNRPDMQLAALETTTSCLVLSGETAVTDDVYYRAERGKVPIIATKEEIPAIIGGIESALEETRFYQEGKLPRIIETMGKQFDFAAMYRGLSLAK